MRRPLPPPIGLDPNHLTKVIERWGSPQLTTFLTKANSEYYHWDEIARRPPPEGLTIHEAWMGVKLSRQSRKPLTLVDLQGKPFNYWLPEQAHETLHRVDRQGGGVLSASVGEPNIFEEMRDRVLIDSLMEEAIATSQIEGAVTTRKVAKELLRTGRKPRDKSERMIVNGYRTIRLIRDRIAKPLTIELIHEIQESMTRDTLENPRDGGRFRRDEDRIHVIDERDGDIVFTPPPASLIEKRLSKLIEFANEGPQSEPFIHPLVRAAILHFWLAYEHPYVDGNGRTARALFYWSMLKSGYWLFEFLTISRIILAAPSRYYRAFLHTETDDNDLTYFLMSQFDVTRKALEDLHKRLREMKSQQDRMQAVRLVARLNSRQKALLDHALRHPTQIYTIESHQHSHGVVYQTARSDLLILAARGLLKEVGGKRPRQFAPAENLAARLSPRTRS